jgi:hypothetical protein
MGWFYVYYTIEASLRRWDLYMLMLLAFVH